MAHYKPYAKWVAQNKRFVMPDLQGANSVALRILLLTVPSNCAVKVSLCVPKTLGYKMLASLKKITIYSGKQLNAYKRHTGSYLASTMQQRLLNRGLPSD
jgi:hypothetical protein